MKILPLKDGLKLDLSDLPEEKKNRILEILLREDEHNPYEDMKQIEI